MKLYPISFFCTSKYSGKDGYDGDGYSLLCNNIATTAIKHGCHIIRNGYYTHIICKEIFLQ